MWKHYYTVSSVVEALQTMADHAGHARFIAGGTDILIELDRGQRPSIDTLIDLSRLPDLDQITRIGGAIRIGALVTHNQIVASDLIQQYGLPLAQASWEVGAPQIRNRATVAGNVITGSPANDTLTPLIALGASVTLESLHGTRQIALADFNLGVRKTAIHSDELLTAIEFPAMAANQRGLFLKLGLRKAQAISVINVAAVLTFADDQQTVTDARIAFGSAAPTIVRGVSIEIHLIGQKLTPTVVAEAGKLAAKVIQPIDDVRGSAEYRIEMASVLVKRALRILAAGDERNNWPVNPPLLSASGALTGQTVQYHADQMTQPIQTTINGQPYTLTGGQDKTLLRLLREDANLPGTKEGCAEGECGACTVWLDGAAVMACMVPAPRADHAEIVTIEGLATGATDLADAKLHPVQQAFVVAGAVQCGYCTPGFVMAGAKLLEDCPDPTIEQIAQSITGNLCRCTGYYQIIEAIRQAAQQKREALNIPTQP
jgi:carbon-monoxide dehydrogenase medium subunit